MEGATTPRDEQEAVSSVEVNAGPVEVADSPVQGEVTDRLDGDVAQKRPEIAGMLNRGPGVDAPKFGNAVQSPAQLVPGESIVKVNRSHVFGTPVLGEGKAVELRDDSLLRYQGVETDENGGERVRVSGLDGGEYYVSSKHFASHVSSTGSLKYAGEIPPAQPRDDQIGTVGATGTVNLAA